ncbi:MAG TPA: alpha/beta fold hydrolase [Verrucomicrobiae bacterium]|nr:alpha/beta fold hydrolase [Verrucomicrobiae bacterium]
MSQHSKPVSLIRLGKLLLWSGLAVYVLLCVVMAIFQRTLIYPAPVFNSQQVDQMAASANLERWKNSSGESVGMKRLSLKQPAIGRVLIFHGNGDYAAGYAFFVDQLQSIGNFDVFILEYPGYADRPGSPSQRSLFRAADEAFQLLDINKPVYLVGQSLGSGVAAYLAGTHPDKVAGVILISPFNRLTSVAQNHYPILPVWLLLLDRFPSEDYLHSYHGKVGVTVDGKDTIVPEKFGLRLFNDYDGPKKLWEFPNDGHASIAEPPEKFWKEVVGFWQTNQTTK